LDEYCFNISKANFKGVPGPSTFWWKTISRVFAKVDISSKRGREEKIQSIVDFGLLGAAVVPTVFLVINNLMLVITIGIIMGRSTDTIALVQNFISIEILVHVHEMIPEVLRLKDRSPEKFNKNWRQVFYISILLLYYIWYSALNRIMFRSSSPIILVFRGVRAHRSDTAVLEREGRHRWVESSYVISTLCHGRVRCVRHHHLRIVLISLQCDELR